MWRVLDVLRLCTVRSTDQPWVNTYTRVLLRKKNRNYLFFKKVNTQYQAYLTNHNTNQEIVTRLKNKKIKAFQKSKISARESYNANRRAKQTFFNSVNSTMRNPEITAKKKFNILTKLMKNQKISSIPSLIENDEIINDDQTKCDIFNDLFISKATLAIINVLKYVCKHV